jgi:hypothetical protein
MGVEGRRVEIEWKVSAAENRWCLKSGSEMSGRFLLLLDLMWRASAIAAQRMPKKQRAEIAKRICTSKMRITRVDDSCSLFVAAEAFVSDSIVAGGYLGTYGAGGGFST